MTSILAMMPAVFETMANRTGAVPSSENARYTNSYLNSIETKHKLEASFVEQFATQSIEDLGDQLPLLTGWTTGSRMFET